MISETGFWNLDGKVFEDNHVFDSKLFPHLLNIVKKRNVKKLYDFGCGNGKYVLNFRKNGIDAVGYDGNPVTSTFENCFVKDLTSQDLKLEPVNFLLCLEVAEHVPKEYEDPLLKNIYNSLSKGGMLVLSWAIEGQPGLGHVNCKNNDYVIERFTKMGYSYDKETSLELRKDVYASWFTNTILVFIKD
jgi:SAM-dependent methyltransferase